MRLLNLGKTRLSAILVTLLLVGLLSGCTFYIDPALASEAQMDGTTLVESGYLPVGDLEMYYEIHGDSEQGENEQSEGEGVPLVLLHGGFMNIDINYAAMIPAWAKDRKVIAFEQQGHGRTGDINRPLTYTQMADDTAAALEALGVEQADIFGYSDGGVVGLGIAIRHPELVRKLAIAGSNYNVEGLAPEIVEFMRSATPADMESFRPTFESLSPTPDAWPEVVEKIMALGTEFEGFTSEEMQGIQAHTLIIIGDADVVTPEHAVEMFNLIPNSHLAVLPATDHFMRLESPQWLLTPLNDFLNAPISEAEAQ